MVLEVFEKFRMLLKRMGDALKSMQLAEM